jgi:ribonuclease J
MMDLTRIGQLGNEGVLMMLAESTNAERAGFSPSERKVGGSLEQIFRENIDQRLVIATFSSNVHRVQQVIDCSVKYGRKVAVLGRSMENVIGAATELGYMNLPEGTLIDVGELKRFRPGQITLVTTGSQGEPMSALYRMAFGSHERIKLTPSDTVVLSSSAIPGNELLIDRIINALIASGIRVVSDATTANVHASGHACAEELKLLHALVRPRYFMPIHGEMRHLHAHKQIAEYMGMPADRIFVGDLGRVLEIDADGARWNGSVPAGKVLVDGAGIGDVGAIVLRDRRLLSQDGLIVVVATVALREKTILSGPDIVSRGFVYVRESEEMMDAAREIAQKSLQRSLDRGTQDWLELKNVLRDDLSKFFFQKTKRSPMILAIVMEV